jgi:hypothetical protein
MSLMAPLLARPPQTLEDYLAMPEDFRAELIDGVLYPMAPGSPHPSRAGPNREAPSRPRVPLTRRRAIPAIRLASIPPGPLHSTGCAGGGSSSAGR